MQNVRSSRRSAVGQRAACRIRNRANDQQPKPRDQRRRNIVRLRVRQDARYTADVLRPSLTVWRPVVRQRAGAHRNWVPQGGVLGAPTRIGAPHGSCRMQNGRGKVWQAVSSPLSAGGPECKQENAEDAECRFFSAPAAPCCSKSAAGRSERRTGTRKVFSFQFSVFSQRAANGQLTAAPQSEPVPDALPALDSGHWTLDSLAPSDATWGSRKATSKRPKRHGGHR